MADYATLLRDHVKAVEGFAKRNGTPIVHFRKGENKEDRCARCWAKRLGKVAKDEWC